MRSQVTFNRVPEKAPGGVWEALVQSQVKFNRVPEKVPEKVPGGFAAEPGQVQQGSEEGSGEGLGGFGAARSGSTGFWRRFPEKVWEALVKSQVKFNRVPEKIPEKVPGSLGAKSSQVQLVPEKVPEKV